MIFKDSGRFLVKNRLKKIPLANFLLKLKKSLKNFFVKPYIKTEVCRVIYGCDREDVLDVAVMEVAEFTKEGSEIVKKKILSGEEDTTSSWVRKAPEEDGEILDWYKNSKEMLYGQVGYAIHSNHLDILPYIRKILKESYGDKRIKILDYGCGIGDHLIFLAKEGYNCSGAEIKSYSSEFIKYRMKKRGLDVHLTELTDNSVPIEEDYDVIICLDVLEHTVNPREIIGRLIQKLDKGGLLFVNFPHSEQPLHLEERHKNFDLDRELLDLGLMPRGIYWVKGDKNEENNTL